MKNRLIGLVALGISLAFSCDAGLAQPPAEAAMPARPEPGEIRLATTRGEAPSGTSEEWFRDHGARVVHNVTVPTLTPFLPPKGLGNGTAIIVAPGGGFMFLSIDSEGYEVAKWLASKGIAAFVLKYRVQPTPVTSAGLNHYAFGVLTSSPDRLKEFLNRAAPVAAEDASTAVRLVRSRAADWGVDPKRVGFLGFSAGAITTLRVGLEPDPAERPDFIASVYGPMTRPDQTIPKPPPPLWTAVSGDDPFFGKPDAGLLSAWHEAGGVAELHYYARGGHGWGFAGAPGTTTVHWKEELLWWLESRGLLRNH